MSAVMNVVRSCFLPLDEDVQATTPVQIAITEWSDPAKGVGAVVHEAGRTPTQPVWEVVGMLRLGDCLALHPVGSADIKPLSRRNATVTVAIADQVQDLVQILLWTRGADPTWPPCPEHTGRHPLRVTQRAQSGADLHSPAWCCPHGSFEIPIGSLR